MSAVLQGEAKEDLPALVPEYSPTERGLAELRSRLQGVVFDVRSGEGEEAARRARKECVSLRTHLETMRKGIKGPALERCRLIDAEAKRIEAEIKAVEQPIDAQIKVVEREREERAAAKRREEQARIDAIQKRIGEIRAMPAKAAGASVADVDELLDGLNALPLDESFAEFLPAAQEAKAEALDRMVALREVAVSRERMEAERAQREAEQRAEAERQRAENERLRAEAEAARAAENRRAQIAHQIGAIAASALQAQTGVDGLTGGSVACIEHVMARLASIAINADTFDGLVEQAENARRQALAGLQSMLAGARQMEVEREELRRHREAEEARRAEEDARIEAEARAQREQAQAQAREQEEARAAQQERAKRVLGLAPAMLVALRTVAADPRFGVLAAATQGLVASVLADVEDINA